LTEDALLYVPGLAYPLAYHPVGTAGAKSRLQFEISEEAVSCLEKWMALSV
jgi:hypothetical protein